MSQRPLNNVFSFFSPFFPFFFSLSSYFVPLFACQSSGQNVNMLNKPFYMFIVNCFSPVWRGYLAVSAIKADCVHSLAGHTPKKGAAWTTSHSWRTNNLYHYISGLTFMFSFTMILIFLWFTDFNYFDFVFSYLQYMYSIPTSYISQWYIYDSAKLHKHQIKLYLLYKIIININRLSKEAGQQFIYRPDKP